MSLEEIVINYYYNVNNYFINKYGKEQYFKNNFLPNNEFEKEIFLSIPKLNNYGTGIPNFKSDFE